MGVTRPQKTSGDDVRCAASDQPTLRIGARFATWRWVYLSRWAGWDVRRGSAGSSPIPPGAPRVVGFPGSPDATVLGWRCEPDRGVA